MSGCGCRMDVRHILVEKHSDAVKILEDIKSGTHCIPSSQPRGPRSRAVLGELSFICIYEYKIIGYLYNCLFLLQKNCDFHASLCLFLSVSEILLAYFVLMFTRCMLIMYFCE